MKIRIEICTDNAAFGECIEDRDAEVGDILHKLAAGLRGGRYTTDPIPLYDTNGNRVGLFEEIED